MADAPSPPRSDKTAVPDAGAAKPTPAKPAPAREPDQDSSPADESNAPAQSPAPTSPWVVILGVFSGVLLISTLVLGVMVSSRNHTLVQNKNRADQNATNMVLLQAELDGAKADTVKLQTQLKDAQTDTARIQGQLDKARVNLTELETKLAKADQEMAQMKKTTPKK